MGALRADPWAAAVAHLLAADARFTPVVERVGPCRLRPKKDRFGTLVRAIISQQISTKAANSIRAKVEAALGTRGVTPRAVLAATPEKLRAAGLSVAKERSIRDLAEKVHSGAVPLDEFKKMAEEYPAEIKNLEERMNRMERVMAGVENTDLLDDILPQILAAAE